MKALLFNSLHRCLPRFSAIVRKPGHLALLFVLAFMVQSSLSKAADPRCFTRNYTWTTHGQVHTMSFDFPWESYDFYDKVPRVYSEYGVYTYEHPEHAVIQALTGQFQAIARKRCLNDWGTVQLVVSFVQQLRYQEEPGEYPKFPIETLADRGGDCEDLSILMVAILRELGYATRLVNPPGHMAVALACKNCDGTYFELHGQKLFYIESTSPQYEIGTAPERYQHTKGKLFSTDLYATAQGYLSRAGKAEAPCPPQYYVREDDHRHPVKLGSETWVASAKVRSMLVNGTKQSMSLLTGIGENDSAVLSPLAWAAANRGKEKLFLEPYPKPIPTR